MKRILFVLPLLAGGLLATAQEKNTVGITYQYALPMGAFKKNFVQDASPRGLAVDVLHTVSPQWRIGGSIGYQDFYQKSPRALYTLEDGSTLSAVQTNSLQTTPLLAKAVYTPATTGRLQPYVSAGAGANMVQVQQLLGQFENVNNVHVGFAAQGGLGFNYALGKAKRTFLTAGAQYNYQPFGRYDIGNLNNLSFGAGVRISLKPGSNRASNDDDYDWNRRRQPRRYYGW